jgi:hypothetical protein
MGASDQLKKQFPSGSDSEAFSGFDSARQNTVWSGVIASAGLSLAVVLLWSFPYWWYPRAETSGGLFWLSARSDLAGWRFHPEPVTKAAEVALAADSVQNGEFSTTRGDPAVVRVFFADHFAENDGELDMFAHTPDRCWTSVGWQLESSLPDFITLEVCGHRMTFERRIFATGGNRELVYFGALVGGRPLPYRLDQYRNVALRRAAREQKGIFGRAFGALDPQLLLWPWRAFTERRLLAGPKQFIRISTPIRSAQVAELDQLLQRFLNQWLVPTEFLSDQRRRTNKS